MTTTTTLNWSPKKRTDRVRFYVITGYHGSTPWCFWSHSRSSCRRGSSWERLSRAGARRSSPLPTESMPTPSAGCLTPTTYPWRSPSPSSFQTTSSKKRDRPFLITNGYRSYWCSKAFWPSHRPWYGGFWTSDRASMWRPLWRLRRCASTRATLKSEKRLLGT